MRKRCRKSGKVKFKTHEQALTRAGELLEQGKIRSVSAHSYLCEHCNHWHISHDDK